MELKKGVVVYILAGHDKGTFQVVMDFDDKFALVCDGKYRKLEKPKKKNLIHIKITNSVLDDDDIKSNRAIRLALRSFGKPSDTKW